MYQLQRLRKNSHVLNDSFNKVSHNQRSSPLGLIYLNFLQLHQNKVILLVRAIQCTDIGYAVLYWSCLANDYDVVMKLGHDQNVRRCEILISKRSQAF